MLFKNRFFDIMKIKKKTSIVLISVLILAIILLIFGYPGLFIEEPTIELSAIHFKELTFGTTEIEIEAILHNPNPMGVNLDKITYNIYFSGGGDDWDFLASGIKEDIEIKANENTTLSIPLKISNIQAIMATFQGSFSESMKYKVNGSVFLDLKITSYEIPFERIMEPSDENLNADSVSLRFSF